MATYYVATTGSDSNPGTLVAPFASLTYANSITAAGDTVRVLPGTYTETLVLNNGGSDWSHPVTFISDRLHGAKIVPASSNTSYVMAVSGQYMIVQGFEVTGPTASVGIYPRNVHQKILKNYIHDIWGFGMTLNLDISNPDRGAGDVTFDSNIVLNCNIQQSADHHNVYVDGPGGGLCTNNIVGGNPAAYGIQGFHDFANWTIANNTVFNCYYGGIVFGQGDSDSGPAGAMVNCTIINNLVLGPVFAAGIRIFFYSGQENYFGTGNVCAYNNVSGCSVPYLGFGTGNASAHTHDVSGSPQFVNYQANGSGDYHLFGSSPCIDAGTSSGAPNHDYDGQARPSGAGYDIGAYEQIPYALFPALRRRYAQFPPLVRRQST